MQYIEGYNRLTAPKNLAVLTDTIVSRINNNSFLGCNQKNKQNPICCSVLPKTNVMLMKGPLFSRNLGTQNFMTNIKQRH